MDKKAQSKFANTSAVSSFIKAIITQKPTSDKQRDPSTHKWIGNKHIVKGGLFKDIKNIPFNPKLDVPHGVCFNCWEYGHSRHKCSKPDLGDHCRNCGRIGIKVTTCPRCSEAHRNYWQKMNNPQNKEVQDLKLELAKVRKAQKWDKFDDKVALYHFAQVKSIPFDPEVDIPFKICANCWKSRHSGQCENDRLHAHCFNCGRIAVFITNCSRCSQAYPQYCHKKVQDGIAETLPMKDENSKKSKEPEPRPEPEKIPPKPSVYKTILPNSTTAKSFSEVLTDKADILKNKDNVLKDKDDGYVSQNGSISNEETTVEIENSMFKFTCDYVRDIKTLMGTIKHLSISNQDAIVSQFIIDRRNKFIEQTNNQRTNIELCKR